jgi:hypothetical protein
VVTDHGRRLVAIAVLAVALGACGDDSEPPDVTKPAITGSDEERIAQTVNALFAAWNNGEGELTCSYLTARGRELMVKIASQLHGLDEEIHAESCEEAVEQTAAATDEEIGQRASPSRVRVEADGTAAVISRFRGELSLREVDSEWLIEVPTFID